ncbi:helix-hairpin-helix domain-containing protein, partial [Chlamydiota bacterium]
MKFDVFKKTGVALSKKQIIILSSIFFVLLVLIIINIMTRYYFQPTENIYAERIESDDDIIIVHISGEVENPGVYGLKKGSKISDVLRKAKPAIKADLSGFIVKDLLYDGQVICIPEISDEKIAKENIKDVKKNRLVDINMANKEDFESLPGIGPVIAERIIEFRKK